MFGLWKKDYRQSQRSAAPTGKVLPIERVVLNKATDESYLTIKNELSQLMGIQVGIVRNKDEMTAALKRINEIILLHPANNTDYNEKKINELATVCSFICVSALERKESRGGHVRSDFPDESAGMAYHIIQEKDKKLTTEEVRNWL